MCVSFSNPSRVPKSSAMSAHYTGELDLQFLRHGKGEYKYPNSVFRFVVQEGLHCV